ncbi:transmembrane 7 superfamily member 3 isoform X2 [Halictus rubicundus]|uniref:transmembrane 7 superfamily member 3 isoform X2 n=1 Tax=Halictus rubicundus TaxID=77578 RepID=UPI0040364BD0
MSGGHLRQPLILLLLAGSCYAVVKNPITQALYAPVPGGCNMEFEHEIAPYTKVQLQDAMVMVDAQPASTPFSNKPNCDKNPVDHKMYQMYLSERDFSAESYFQGIISMLTVDDIVVNGYETSHYKLISPMRRIYSAYTGIGSVYATVATYGDKSAAYVPTFSYACRPVQDPNSCEILTDTFPKVVCALCFFMGLITILSGQTSFIVDQFAGFLFVGTMIGYLITGTIGYGILIGVGTAAMLCWIRLSTSVNVGWFIACILFFLTPESLSILHINWVFLLCFILTVTLCSILVALTGTFISALITGALYSSFMIVLPLDYWFGSSLKYILINPIRRATIAGFSDAIIIQPVQGKDIFLIILWLILALIRLSGCSRLVTNNYIRI